MADRRSKYYFSNESDYEKAKNHIRELMYQDYWDSDKIYFEGYYGGEYLISIMTECSNPILAASLCEEHHGEFRV